MCRLARLGLIESPDATYACSRDGQRQCRQSRLAAAVACDRDIGVRIEDDYVITADGRLTWLTSGPREVREIEARMRAPRR